MAIIVTDIESEEPIVTPQEQKKLLEYSPTDDSNEDLINDTRNETFDVYRDIKFVSGSSGTSGTAGTSGTSGTAGTSGISGTAGTSSTSGTSGTGFIKNPPTKKGKEQPEGAKTEVRAVVTPKPVTTAEENALIEKIKTNIPIQNSNGDFPFIPSWVVDLLPIIVHDYEINNTARIAHFFGQIRLECGWGPKREDPQYSDQQLLKTFRGRFTKEEAKDLAPLLYQENKKSIKNPNIKIQPNQKNGWVDIAYGARNGPKNGNTFNAMVSTTIPSETVPEAWAYRGGGFIQLTGKSNWSGFTNSSKQTKAINFLLNPDKIKEEKWALYSALWYWGQKGRRSSVLQDTVTPETIHTVTIAVNGTAEHAYDKRRIFTEDYYAILENGVVDMSPDRVKERTAILHPQKKKK